jgi:hypothetical protein
MPTAVAIAARASSIPRPGSLARTRAPSPSVRAIVVSATNLGSRVVSKTPAAAPSRTMSDAEQRELLPEQPLVRALVVAG